MLPPAANLLRGVRNVSKYLPATAIVRETRIALVSRRVGRRITSAVGGRYLAGHLVAMGELHRAGRYDRLADGVERVTGRRAMSVREFAALHADEFGGRRP